MRDVLACGTSVAQGDGEWRTVIAVGRYVAPGNMRLSILHRLLIAASCWTYAAPASAASAGTHFLLELDGGALLSGSGGPAVRTAFGAGGKLKGFPVRFYLLGQVGASAYTATPSREDAGWLGSEQGSFYDFALGPRLYLPIIGPLRVFVEGLLGASRASGIYDAPGRASLQAYEWLALAQLSAGLQWRVLHELSCGVRAGLAFTETGLTGVARSAGAHDVARPSLMAGVTWHF